MPRHSRAASNPHNRYDTTMAEDMGPTPMYNQRMTMSNNYYGAPSSSAPMPMHNPAQQSHQQHQHQAQQQQAQQQQAYDSYVTASAPLPIAPPPVQHRASSGAWTPQDDQQLLQARMQGLNWSQIQINYFPGKTPNACRKRHERLMERKGADDWDNRKMQRMAKEYMGMRKEIWSELASRTGEKWNVVEQKCMSQVLKNLQSAARAASRRDRLESGGPLSGYDDDSGISGIALTPVDELDASYSSPETSSSAHSAASSASYHHLQPHPRMQALNAGQGYGMSAFGGYGGHGYSSSVSSTASAHGYATGTSQSPSPYMNGQRLPSVDMGIGSIINRPNGL